MPDGRAANQPFVGHDLQAADGAPLPGAVVMANGSARRRAPCVDLIGCELLEPPLLLDGGRGVDALVDRRAELARELARSSSPGSRPGDRRHLGREQAER